MKNRKNAMAKETAFHVAFLGYIAQWHIINGDA
jgi:hypothetical protein